MPTFSIHEAKSQLSRLIAAAERGEDVVIARGKEPVARLVRLAADPPAKRVFGALKGKVHAGPEFFEPLPEDELQSWEGNGGTGETGRSQS